MKLTRVAPVTVSECESDTTGERHFIVTSRHGEHQTLVCYVGDDPDLRMVRHIGAADLREQIARKLLAKARV